MADGWSVGGSALCVERQNAPRPDADPRIEKIVASVSEERLKELLTKLVSFGTRNTLSDQDSPTRGIGAARNWILEEMRRSSEKLRVNFDTHQIAPQGRITEQVDSAQRHGRSCRDARRAASTSAVTTTRSTSADRISRTRRRPARTPPAIARRVPDSIPTSRPTAPTTTAAAPC
jgi:hypothetical protein